MTQPQSGETVVTLLGAVSSYPWPRTNRLPKAIHRARLGKWVEVQTGRTRHRVGHTVAELPEGAGVLLVDCMAAWGLRLSGLGVGRGE